MFKKETIENKNKKNLYYYKQTLYSPQIKPTTSPKPPAQYNQPPTHLFFNGTSAPADAFPQCLQCLLWWVMVGFGFALGFMVP